MAEEKSPWSGVRGTTELIEEGPEKAKTWAEGKIEKFREGWESSRTEGVGFLRRKWMRLSGLTWLASLCLMVLLCAAAGLGALWVAVTLLAAFVGFVLVAAGAVAAAAFALALLGIILFG